MADGTFQRRTVSGVTDVGGDVQELTVNAVLTGAPADVVAASALPLAAQDAKPDAEGYIRDWLVLAPLPIGDGGGADAIEKKQFADEADPKGAKDGTAQKVGGKELMWEKVTTKTFYIDFKELATPGEQVVGWAVAYLVAPADKTGLVLHMNSNDQGKVYLNGQELFKYLDARTLEKDSEDKVAGVTLKKGVNVLVLKVANEENNWQGSVRFVDAAGKPVTDIKVQTAR